MSIVFIYRARLLSEDDMKYVIGVLIERSRIIRQNGIPETNVKSAQVIYCVLAKVYVLINGLIKLTDHRCYGANPVRGGLMLVVKC